MILGSGTPPTTLPPNVVGRIESVPPSQGVNPFVSAGVNSSPFIPNLVGGAEAFGFAPGSVADYASLSAAVGQPDAASVGALVRLDGGLSGLGAATPGFDVLAFINLSGGKLLEPMLGVGSSGVLLPLVVGGFARLPEFDPLATGLEPIGALESGQVYVTLVPEGVLAFSAKVAGLPGLIGKPLGNGDVVFLTVPEPSLLTLVAIATWLWSAVRRY